MNPGLKKLIPLIIAIALALAVMLGLMRRKNSPEVEPISMEIITKQESNSSESTLWDYYQTAQRLKKVSTTTTETTFIAGGDISLSRNIAATIDKTKNPLTPFKGVSNLLASVDFTFANLETPFSKNDTYTASNTLVFNAPQKNIEGLVKNNIKVVNLANNHAFDQGLIGITTTKNWLEKNKINFMGTGSTLDEAWQPSYYTSSGVTIAFIGASYSSVNDGGKATNNYVARIEDIKHLQQAITEAKQKAAYVVVTMHAGTEYTRTPNQGQIDFAHTAIDDGADMVIGAHPHWIQTIETYQGKYIFYSLGNFIFDQDWSQDTKEGLLLKINLEKLGGNNSGTQFLQGNGSHAILKQIDLVPIIIENNSTPRPANETESKNILKKIHQDSSVLN